MAVLINKSYSDIEALVAQNGSLVTIYVQARSRMTLSDEYVLVSANENLVWESDLSDVVTLVYPTFPDAILALPYSVSQGTMVKTQDGFIMTVDDDYGIINTKSGHKLAFYSGFINELNRAKVYADVILTSSPATYNFASTAEFEASDIPAWFTLITVLEGTTLNFLLRQVGGPWVSGDGAEWRLVNVPLDSITPSADAVLTTSGASVQDVVDDYYAVKPTILLPSSAVTFTNAVGFSTTPLVSTDAVSANGLVRLSQVQSLLSNSLLGFSNVDGLQAALNGKAALVHTHVIADTTGLQAELNNRAPLVHTHVIGDTTGLQTALNGKAALVHTHVIADISSLQTTLNGKAATSHTHTIANVTNLQTTLNGKAALVHTHVIADTTGLQTALDTKSAIGHGHIIADTTDLQIVLDGKAPTSHNHNIGDINNLWSNLNGKAPFIHTHTISDVTDLQTTLDAKVPNTGASTIAGVKTFSSPIVVTATFAINGTTTGAQPTGLYLADLGATSGTTLNPTDTAAIMGQISTARSVGFSVDASGRLFGFRSFTSGSPFIWQSYVSKADKLATARNIGLTGDVTGTASFDGTSNASVAATLANSGVTAGIYGSATLIPKLTIDVKGRITDAVQMVPSGTWDISISGLAASATKLETARTISLSGGVTGSVSFNGTANVAITATVDPTAHVHTIAQVTSLQTSLDAKQGLDAKLTGLTGVGSTLGFIAQTISNTFAARTLSIGSNTGLALTNANGASGNPTFSGVTQTDVVWQAGTSTIESVISANKLTRKVMSGKGYTSTVTSGGSKILTSDDTARQIFTGTGNHTLNLPSPATLLYGWDIQVENKSTGVIWVKLSTGADFTTIPYGVTAIFTCYGPNATDWVMSYVGSSSITGSGALVMQLGATLLNPILVGATVTTSLSQTAGAASQGSYTIPSDYNVITTTAANPSGVTLPILAVGQKITVMNKGSNALNVYPAVGYFINDLGANLPITIEPQEKVTLVGKGTYIDAFVYNRPWTKYASAVDTSSGTYVDMFFPSWVSEIEIYQFGVSANSLANLIFQMGSGGVVAGTSGYGSISISHAYGTASSKHSATNGFVVALNDSEHTSSGIIKFKLIEGRWFSEHLTRRLELEAVYGSGSMAPGTVSGNVDQIRMKPTSGVFDGGSMNVRYR